jgi:hypothetical protein
MFGHDRAVRAAVRSAHQKDPTLEGFPSAAETQSAARLLLSAPARSKMSVSKSNDSSAFVRHSFLLALAMAGAACSATAEGDPASSESLEEPLARENSWDLWPKVGNNYPINVCFRACRLEHEDPDEVETQAQCDEGKANVEAALREYARYSRVTLPATIAECPNSGDRNPGWIRINFARPDKNAGGTNNFVRYVDGVKQTVPGAGYPGTNWQLRTSTGSQNRGIIRHEFGHALGFAHEYRRGDEPSGTTCIDGGKDLTPTTGSVTNLSLEYDHDSIMNYSYCNWVMELSPADVEGLQVAYGAPFSRSIVNARMGMCVPTLSPILGPVVSCNGTNSVAVGYNLTSILGTAAGIHRATSPINVLDVDGGALRWTDTRTPGTHPSATWRLVNARIVAYGSLCLTRGGASGPVTLTACNDNAASTQAWTFNARNRNHQYSISSAGLPTQCLVNSDGLLRTGSCTASPMPLLGLDHGNGRFKSGNLCMVVDGGKPKAGSGVRFAPCSTAAAQQWLIRAQLENTGTGRCLRTTSSQMLRVDTCSDTASWTWDIRP